MPVAAHQDLHLRPACADLADQPAQMRGDLAALGAPGRAQHRRDEAPVRRGNGPPDRFAIRLTIEDDDRLDAVTVVMGVEQAPLLASKVSSMPSVIRLRPHAKLVR
jgi:hypothetical protein